MSKQEFLNGLQTALIGEVGEEAITDNLKYYDDYISAEVRKGKTEDEILKILGDPRLIAKTISETNSDVAHHARAYQYEDTGSDQGSNTGNTGAYGNQMYRFSGWRATIILVIILIVVVMLVGTVLSVLLPIIIPIAAVLFIISLFKNMRN